MTLVDVLCFAFLGWGLLGFWKGLSLPAHFQHTEGGWPTPNPEAWAHFDPVKAIKRRSLWAGLIEHKYGGQGK